MAEGLSWVRREGWFPQLCAGAWYEMEPPVLCGAPVVVLGKGHGWGFLRHRQSVGEALWHRVVVVLSGAAMVGVEKAPS